MSKAAENEYTEQEFIEDFDNLNGIVLTLEETVGNYVETLRGYLAGEKGEHELRGAIEPVVDSLESLYDSVDDIDEKIEDQTMEARVKRAGKKGVCNLSEKLSEITDTCRDIENVDHLLELSHYVDEYADLEPDLYSARKKEDENREVATRILLHAPLLREDGQRLERSYNWLAYTEILARRNLENSELDPPLLQMHGSEHEEKARKMEREVMEDY